jgi:hypothetical protein
MVWLEFREYRMHAKELEELERELHRQLDVVER